MIIETRENLEHLLGTSIGWDELKKTEDNYKETLDKMIKWMSVKKNSSSPSPSSAENLT